MRVCDVCRGTREVREVDFEIPTYPGFPGPALNTKKDLCIACRCTVIDWLSNFFVPTLPAKSPDAD